MNLEEALSMNLEESKTLNPTIYFSLNDKEMICETCYKYLSKNDDMHGLQRILIIDPTSVYVIDP